MLAVSKGPQSQFRYSLWYRSSHGTDLNSSEIVSPVLQVCLGRRPLDFVRLCHHLSSKPLVAQCNHGRQDKVDAVSQLALKIPQIPSNLKTPQIPSNLLRPLNTIKS